jgi:response regulator RpfG family c-di-GMP phosphodiesterase
MIKFSLVDVRAIQSNVPRSNFSEEQIEQLADMILECEGVLNVISLSQTGINNYIVLAGDLEYYAAVRAKEKNPRQGEMINAVIVQPSNQDTALKQADFFKKGVEVIDETSLISRLEKQMREFMELQIRENKEIKHGLQQLENTVNNLTDNLAELMTKLKYDAMTLVELKEIAKQRHIKRYSTMKKSALIAILLSQD